MKLSASFIVCVVLAVAACAFGDSTPKQQKALYQKFEQMLKDEKYDAAEKHLQEWGRKSPNDAELAVAWGNYHSIRDEQPVRIYAGEEQTKNVDPTKGETFELQQAGTTETVGFIDTRPALSDNALTRSLAVLRDATTSHPQRTDIWMGATHVQLLAQDYDGALRTLDKFARYAKNNPKGLTTRYDEPVKDKPDEFMARSLHSYSMRGYKEETTAGLEFMLSVARLAQELYPTSPYAYNDEAVYYSALQDDEKVLASLLRAHKVRPKDALVIINIGATYKNLKKNDKAREYFQLAVKTADDDELKAAAREALEELKDSE